VNNYATYEGGGICIFDSDVKIYNNIIWGNYANSGASGLATYTHPVLYNCIIEKGLAGIGNVNDLQIINLITKEPSFKLPNTIVGLSDSAMISDWSIDNFSSAINQGVLPKFTMPINDVAGNKRINQGNIDIGAYENQSGKLEFTKQPIGSTLCAGDSITLFVASSDTAEYQWQKDGTDIGGATSKSYSLNSVKEIAEGNYSCIISNSYGKVFSNPAFIKVRTLPEILEQPKSLLVAKESETKLQVRADGSKPLTYIWKKDNVNLIDTTNILAINSFEANNEGVYKCVVKNNCGSVSTSDINMYMAPSICMVSVTSPKIDGSPYNTIVWTKESKINYSKYNIYRESTIAGFYDKIGTVNSSAACVFRDTLVDPRKQSFLYKITGVMNDNSETDINLCNFHKTIHLLVTANLQGYVQLDWDQYIGFPYSTYYIYRSIKGAKFVAIDSISTSSRTWTDLNYKFDGDTVYYFISIKKADPCYPGGIKKAGGDIFDQSVSNIEDNRLRSGTSITNIDADNMHVYNYPNPFDDFTNINYTLDKPEKVTIELFNSLGKTMTVLVSQSHDAGNHKFRLDSKKLQLADGVYTLKLFAGNKMLVIKLIKVK
jgi:hypothetical protein